MTHAEHLISIFIAGAVAGAAVMGLAGQARGHDLGHGPLTEVAVGIMAARELCPGIPDAAMFEARRLAEAERDEGYPETQRYLAEVVPWEVQQIRDAGAIDWFCVAQRRIAGELAN